MYAGADALPNDCEALRRIIREQAGVIEAKNKQLDEVISLSEVLVVERDRMLAATGSEVALQKRVVAAEDAVRMVEEVLHAWVQSRHAAKANGGKSDDADASLLQLAGLQRKVSQTYTTESEGPLPPDPEAGVTVVRLTRELERERQRYSAMESDANELSKSLGDAEAEIVLLQRQLDFEKGKRNVLEQQCQALQSLAAAGEILSNPDFERTMPIGGPAGTLDAASDARSPPRPAYYDDMPYFPDSPEASEGNLTPAERRLSNDIMNDFEFPSRQRTLPASAIKAVRRVGAGAGVVENSTGTDTGTHSPSGDAVEDGVF